MNSDTSPNEAVALAVVRDVLKRAPSHQGGHSEVGRRMAGLLGIPFPINMKNLHRRALELGENPDVLWPWYTPAKEQ